MAREHNGARTAISVRATLEVVSIVRSRNACSVNVMKIRMSLKSYECRDIIVMSANIRILGYRLLRTLIARCAVAVPPTLIMDSTMNDFFGMVAADLRIPCSCIGVRMFIEKFDSIRVCPPEILAP